MAEIRLDTVTKRFGSIEAVRALSLEIHDGEFFCILGPPRSGKSVVLRLIVGLESPDDGTIYIDGEPVNGVHPGRRDVAMIFQNLALYPDKTVFDNIAFPLREQKVPAHEIDERVLHVAQTLHIDHLLQRKPGKLSGGERQRVAIGRAIVRRPRAYLMDEPLANLDALLRAEMRVELKHLQHDLGQTLIYVTNDQIEAMSMADRIAVLRDGELQQCDSPQTVYNRPANRFVASLVGAPPMNLVPCEVQRDDGALTIVHPVFALRAARLQQALHRGAGVLMGIRPEDIQIFDSRPSGQAMPAEVSVIEPLGAEIIVDLRLGADVVRAIAPPTRRFRDGQAVWVRFDGARIHLFDLTSGQRIYSSNRDEALVCGSRIRT